MADQPQPAPAFYALPGGGLRDWWTVLHPPYTLWHLSYVALGAGVAPMIHADRLIGTLLAFFFAVGIGAHVLDELNGRPLRTAITSWVLQVTAIISITGAIALGVIAVDRAGPSLFPLIAFGAFIVAAYNLEWFGGRFHTGFWFAFAWGAFPAFTGYWVNAVELRPEGIAVALACFALSTVQRALSTPVRALRRRTTSVEGRIERTDGTVERIDRAAMTQAPETALRALSLGLPTLAAALLFARLS